MSKIVPCLWFNGDAEQAASFYVSLLPDSRIESVMRSPIDNPSGPAGAVLVVEFTLVGQRFMGLNGGIKVEHTDAVSFKIGCESQAEVDRLWDALCADGGAPVQCGWLRDRWGMRWQIVPDAMMQYLAGPDRVAAQRAMAAMMTMVKLDVEGLRRAYEGGSAG